MKIIAIGRNYADHAKELNNPVPDEPVVFLMPDTCLINNNAPFFYPDFSKDIHHELEIVLRINRVGKNIQPRFAHRYFDEISVGIDFTARDLQKKAKEKGLPWEKAKAFDGSAVISEFYSKVNYDLENLNFQLYKNKVLVQDGNTQSMLWEIDEIISYVSQFFTLKIGDVIFTGTPAGVGAVKPKDVLIGKIENKEMFKVNIK